ncbi:MAG: alanine--glyoxylate aminotransferase family protein [Halobacteriovoraceae bacterium]|nr:alanine--glyoxylate aminotransferase family protein [Halobacteriovoraceae bacterium]
MASFYPKKRILLGPGPSDVSQRVLDALARDTIGHLDPCFVEFMEDTKDLLRKTFLTKNKMTFPLSAPGSAAMEMALVNLLEENDKIVICINGVFGKRMLDIANRIKAKPIALDFEWGKEIDPNVLRETLKKEKDVKAVALVHAETSTGVLSDAKNLAQIAKEFGCLSIVDTVTSLGGIELKVDEWELDVVYSGTQKCLSAPPGLAPITFSDNAIESIQKRKSPCPSWFLDLNLLLTYWNGDGGRSYHHTAPINNLYGLHESLLQLHDEGLENSWIKHTKIHNYFKNEMAKIGLEFFVRDGVRLPNLNAIRRPEKIDDAKFRSSLLNQHNIEIGAGLGPMAGKIWRIGLMGTSATKTNVDEFVKAFKIITE